MNSIKIQYQNEVGFFDIEEVRTITPHNSIVVYWKSTSNRLGLLSGRSQFELLSEIYTKFKRSIENDRSESKKPYKLTNYEYRGPSLGYVYNY